jgi:hypothetical protein
MKPWKILYRQNQSAIETATVQRQSIPSLVSPSVRAFYIHHLYGGVDIDPDAEHVDVLRGGYVYFYMEFNNPDEVEFEFFTIMSSVCTPVSYGNGFLFEVLAYAAQLEAESGSNSVDPTFTIAWRDESNNQHLLDAFPCSNGPLVINNIDMEYDKTILFTGDTVTGTILPNDLVEEVTMDWENTNS